MGKSDTVFVDQMLFLSPSQQCQSTDASQGNITQCMLSFLDLPAEFWRKRCRLFCTSSNPVLMCYMYVVLADHGLCLPVHVSASDVGVLWAKCPDELVFGVRNTRDVLYGV